VAIAEPPLATAALSVPPRETLVEAVARALVRYIAARGLRGGDRLPSERQLVQMVGASRLPLREALCVLKGLGIIEAKHGKGIFVKQLDMAAVFGMLSPLLRTQADIDLPRIFEVRLHLEAAIAELAAANRNPQNLDRLQEALDGMAANLRHRRAYIQHDTDFHQELARSTGNSVFHVFMSSITDLLAELQVRYRDRIEFREAAVGEHAAILEAVQAGDAARARAAMQLHIRNATERL